MNIKVLGSGCKKCKQLEANVQEAVKDMGLEATIEKVEDFKDIMSFGVMSTPALVVDGEVKFSGQLVDVKNLKKYLI